MGIILNRELGKYEVDDLELEHNHVLQTPETCHLIPSQRRISEVQAFEIEMADASGIQPRIAHEFASRHVGGAANLGYSCRDHKNYLRTKRQKEMKYGEAGSLLNYFHNKDSRPFGVFVGFNHFRETVVFWAALMYDESVDSFKWLFETFLSTHNQKKPRTIYTDQDVAMGKAITDVLPETWHGLCTWHIMQNAIKHLNRHMVEGSNVLGDFSACMYEYEDMVKFEDVFSKMRAKVHKQTWLDSIYKVKEKWAECYMKDVYTLGMRSTQLSESLNNDMKEYLNSELNILRFFSHFERAVQAKRDKEITSEYNSREKLPRIQMRTPMLLQASKIYTPQIFEAFQSEYERSMAAYTRPSSEGNTYIVGIGVLDEESTLEEEHVVVFYSSERKVVCTCKLFERTGLLCSHALKVLDLMNIKQLPEHYIMKRWTREVRCGTVHDAFGRNVLADPKVDMTRRYKYLAHKFIILASRAADFEECFLLVDNVLDSLCSQVEQKIKLFAEGNANQSKVEATTKAPNKMAHVIAGLKKRETKKGGSKRKKNWVDKLRKGRKQGSSQVESQEPSDVGAMVTRVAQPQTIVEKCFRTDQDQIEDSEFIGSYTQLLMRIRVPVRESVNGIGNTLRIHVGHPDNESYMREFLEKLQ
ncbi:protein FAR1-RELATED SEQUENCE 5-like [Phragmites australis]|uniref:protein FAR1-RELATED SEQUENCE 5-like n=1 Tax=Phragmites australis TaxID=29695 RepID=UPI002D7912AB|nr:protein FAR1-RELATED SEQUENCE 5-like [Phragmites australis]